MRVLVCGGRDYDDATCVATILREHWPDVVIHGGATGADRLADVWARERAVDVDVYPADWEAHGRAAGPIRNQQMIDDGKPDLVIAFPGGRGTEDMVRRAMKAGIEVIRPV